MSAIASDITGVSIPWSTVCSGSDQRKHQSSASLAFTVCWIHRWPVNSPQKRPVTGKMLPFDLTLLKIDRFLPFKVQILITFSSENYYSDCIVIAKTFIDLAGGTMALILRQDAANFVTDLRKAKTNTIPFKVIRQDKISHWVNVQAYTTVGQPGWSTGAAQT